MRGCRSSRFRLESAPARQHMATAQESPGAVDGIERPIAWPAIPRPHSIESSTPPASIRGAKRRTTSTTRPRRRLPSTLRNSAVSSSATSGTSGNAWASRAAISACTAKSAIVTGEASDLERNSRLPCRWTHSARSAPSATARAAVSASAPRSCDRIHSQDMFMHSGARPRPARPPATVR